MHQTTQLVKPRSRSKAGFSLVEVTLAIGIIAFAFVALFSLLPTGLNVYRASIDSANEMWIVQGINSMLQTADWKKAVSDLEENEYYFDEEGRMTDSLKEPSSDQDVKLRRLYVVKVVLQNAYRPDRFDSASSANGAKEPLLGAKRVIVLMAPLADPLTADLRPDVKEEFTTLIGQAVAPNGQLSIPVGTKIRIRTLTIARMDNEADVIQ